MAQNGASLMRSGLAAPVAPMDSRAALPLLPQGSSAPPVMKESSDDMAHRALLEIDRYLSLRNMKTLDLFKMRSINTSANSATTDGGGGDDMLLSSDELIALLKLTQVRLTRTEVQAVINLLDQDGNGELDVRELDDALRAARKRMRNIPTDAMTQALRNSTADFGSRFGGPRRGELKQIRRMYIPQMIQNRYYQRPVGGHIRAMPPKPKKLWGIWQYNRSVLDCA